jgi:adenine-specific DNA-methyltransferase
MAKKIESIKHSKDKRAHIPSKEEAGYEDANPKVQQGKKIIELPKNPVVHRGQDPELFWLNKYGNDDREDLLRVDIRSLYRHEHIAPETLIDNLYKVTEVESAQGSLFNDLFGNALDKDELEKVSEYYHHQDGWTNRLIQGDSHLVMASLLEREGMARSVQTIFFDPPYGINYNKNWQININDRSVGSVNDDDGLTGEPEMIKAFRDTWEQGIHSYLTYLRDRLLIAKELLTESGSCFVQISDDNVHLVRVLLDEVFGSENFVNMISFSKAGGGLTKSESLGTKLDYLLWYCKDIKSIKFRPLFEYKFDPVAGGYTQVEEKNGTIRSLTKEEKENLGLIPKDAKLFMSQVLTKPGPGSKYEITYKGKVYNSGNRWWGMPKEGLEELLRVGRAYPAGNTLRYKRYFDDFPYSAIDNLWVGFGGQPDQKYVVQTNTNIVQRCILMTSDPADLVLDPTCGSGTTAYVAEQYGRRWITIDTSRIALNIAKQRLMTSVFPFYQLHDETHHDVRQGFVYKNADHITSKTIAKKEEPEKQTLYDQPLEDKKKLRVSGPFTVETLQNFEPIALEKLEEEVSAAEDNTGFEETVKQHLMSAGVKNGRKDEQVVFTRVELLSHSFLHAEGFYMNGTGEKKAYIHIGPKFGTVSKNAVNEAVKECRARGDAQWLIILGFSFESDIEGSTQTMNMGKFEVTKARIHDDLMQDGLKKKPGKSAASFVTIGEPDIVPHKKGKTVTIEIQGLDIYDPIKDEVKARNISDIAYWMVDDDYDGSNFIVKQVFFCGGEKDEFDKWKKGLESLAKDNAKKKVEKTLKIEIDDEAFDRLYGHISHPIEVTKKGQKIAVRVISQFGEETMKVLTV